MENSRTPVVIAGAGPVGLALALGLARCGVRSLVLEKKAALSEHSKAAVVLTRTLEIFHAWGIVEEFKTTGQWIEELVPRDINGAPLAHLRLKYLRGESPTAGACLLPQNETECLLFEACQASGLVEVRFGHSVTNFEANAQGVKLTVTSESGEPYLLETEYLCGCDGAHSAVRAGLGLHLEGITYPIHAILADVRLAARRNPQDRIRADLNSPQIRALIRFTPDRWRLLVLIAGPTDETPPAPEFVQRHVEAMLGESPQAIEWASSFKLHCRTAPTFRVGRVILAGDAAHLNSPAGGMGMNAGIQDAHNLAWKLALALKGGPTEALLDSYNAERQDFIRRGVDVTTDRLTRLGVAVPPWQRLLALRLVRFLLHFRKLATKAVQNGGMLSFRYRPSPLVDASGGMLYAKRKSRPGKPSGAIYKDGKNYVTVRPDDFVAYRGPDQEKAKGFLKLIRGGHETSR